MIRAIGDKARARPSDQALAVPVEPVSRLAPPGFDPSRIERACVALDAVLDEAIADWGAHVRRCVLAVAGELGK